MPELNFILPFSFFLIGVGKGSGGWGGGECKENRHGGPRRLIYTDTSARRQARREVTSAFSYPHVTNPSQCNDAKSQDSGCYRESRKPF